MPVGGSEKVARMDWTVLLAALALCVIGLLNVYSGTRSPITGSSAVFYKQGIWICLGIVAFGVAYFTAGSLLEQLAKPLYFVSLGLLVVVLVAGKVAGGAQRWISLGGFNLQPSEFTKISLVLLLARHFADSYSYQGIGLSSVGAAIGYTLAPFLLVALQPDLGTAGVFMILLAGMMVASGVRWRVLASFAAVGATVLPSLWFVMKDYQKQRILMFMDPESDPLGAGYHVIQSKIAVGSGGFLGKGYLHGTQGALRFLPEQHTDFAFAVFAEEWGFVGSAVLIALFVILVGRCFLLAARSQDRFASFACAGMAVIFLSHAAINLSMVCGLFPVVGIPLPFVSYGGSAMLTNMLALGVVASLSRSRFTFQGSKGMRSIDP